MNVIGLISNLGVVALVTFICSFVVWAAWRMLSPVILKMTPLAEGRLLFTFAMLPLLVAIYMASVNFEFSETPSAGEGHSSSLERSEGGKGSENSAEHVTVIPNDGSQSGVDSILLNDSENVSTQRSEFANQTPFIRSLFSLLLIAGGVFLLLRFLLMLWRAAHAIYLSREVSRLMCRVSTNDESDNHVYESDSAEAFVMGVIRPRLFVSSALLNLPSNTVKAVLAHERAHIAQRDPLRHLCIRIACIFHLPWVGTALRLRSQQVQELAADDIAAVSIGDRLTVAEALLECGRASYRLSKKNTAIGAVTTRVMGPNFSSGQLAFNSGDLTERVKALLADRRSVEQPRVFWLMLVTLIIMFSAAQFSDDAHRLIESSVPASFLVNY